MQIYFLSHKLGPFLQPLPYITSSKDGLVEEVLEGFCTTANTVVLASHCKWQDFIATAILNASTFSYLFLPTSWTVMI